MTNRCPNGDFTSEHSRAFYAGVRTSSVGKGLFFRVRGECDQRMKGQGSPIRIEQPRSVGQQLRSDDLRGLDPAPRMRSISSARLLLFAICLAVPSQLAWAQLDVPSDKDVTPAITSADGSGSGVLSVTGEPLPIREFDITQTRLDAEVVGDRVKIQATVEVVINFGADWHRIPLHFGQAAIESREYEGSGQEMPDVAPEIGDEGISWMLKGVGKHLLRFSMWVPIRTSLSGAQLRLALPPLPEQFVTHLSLIIPDPEIVFRPAKNLTVLETTRTTDQTTVLASVSGPWLDVSWSTPSASGPAIAQVGTRIHVKPADDRIAMIADQIVEFYQPGTEEVRVQLPSEFRLVDLSGSHYRAHEPMSGRDNWIKVFLTSDARQRLDLRWVFEREGPLSDRQIIVDGFHFDGAVREEGLIRIDEFSDQHVRFEPGESQMVHRADVNQVRQFGIGTPQAAFEFLKNPYRLVLDLSPKTPYFVVSPLYELIVRPNELELRVHTEVRVEDGDVSESPWAWSEMTDEWEARASQIVGEPELGVSIGTMDESGGFTVSFASPLTSDFQLTSVFRKSVDLDEEGQFEISLPVPTTPRREPGNMIIRAADALEVTIEGQNDAGAPMVPASCELPADLEVATEEVRECFQLTPEEHVVRAEVVRHEREIQAETTVEILEFSGTELQIRQQTAFAVAYGRVGDLQFLVPEALHTVPVVEFEGSELATTTTGETIQIDLPRPVKGEFVVDLLYRFPIELAGESTPVDVPFFSLREPAFSMVKCHVIPTERAQVRAEEPWSVFRDGEWIAIEVSPTPGIPLILDPQLADSSQQYIIERAWYRTHFQQNGQVDTWVDYQLHSVPERIVLTLPPETDLEDFRLLLDGTHVPRSAYGVRSERGHEVSLDLPEGNRPTVLSVQFRNRTDGQFRLTQSLDLSFPQFSKSVWINETIWEIRLPASQHLFTYPTLEPQFSWKRDVLFWRRQLTDPYLQERAARQVEWTPASFQFQAGMFYAFRGFGPLEQVSFRSMDRSLILLIGAGVTLVLGFMFWRIPHTRNVFSLVVLCFLFAVGSLYFPAPMLLLLQPAALGAMLALTATMVNSATQRRSRAGADESWSTPSSAEGSLAMSPTRIYRPTSRVSGSADHS